MEKKKSVQRLTVFEGIDTVEKVKDYLDNNPKDLTQLTQYFYKQLNETYQAETALEDKYLNLTVACHKYNNDIDSEEKIRNITYEANHQKITTCIHNYILEYRCFPMSVTIENETGLSRTTVYKHLKNGGFVEGNKLVKGKLQYMASHALSKLYLIGIQDRSVSALKSFIELSGATKKTTEIINYIQINNLKITKEEFERLPEKSMVAIEEIISKNIPNNR